jgi:hypothetical protein
MPENLNADNGSVENLDSRRNEIQRLAYFLWQNAGQPSGTADRDWFLAEHAIETGAVSPSGPQTVAAEGGGSSRE